jgi:hypothetical protein
VGNVKKYAKINPEDAKEKQCNQSRRKVFGARG